MKISKRQDPSSREAPNYKLQHRRDRIPSVESWEEIEDTGALMLKDEPPKDRELHPFDLEERTARFGERIIRFVKKIPRGVDHPENNRLVDQLFGCGTSVGANYREANEGVSKKDFRHPISRCVKEAKETMFFLRMVAASEPQLNGEARELYREAAEFVRIFSSMYRK
jgi:four helix bundle protein